MKLRTALSNLPFEYPFTISKGTKTHQPSLLVELEHFGRRGYGEAPAISYYNVTTDHLLAVAAAKKMFIEKFAYTEPDRYWHYLHHLLPGAPFLVCALDIASWDMFGKLKGKSLSALWNLDPATAPVSDYTIGMDLVERMVEKMLAHPWPVYKIKLGGSHETALGSSCLPDDLSIIKALRLHTDAPFRVDANAAWTTEEALEKIPLLADLGVELVEQPLARDNWEGSRLLFERSVLPVFADESCVMEGDVARCAGHFHGINIKLTKCSGITPALRMVKEARSLGLKIMGGSMNETSVGTAALAAMGPLFDYADFDGPLLLSGDVADGLTFEEGKAMPSGKPGLGIGMREGVFDAPPQ
jgi:L-alanine-DL-glutamate epimerase-like enolase superfamily enzyme